MIERIPPHNEEAERSVLGAAMLNKEVLFDILEEVKEDDFYNESHKEIFRAIWELYRKNSAVDMLTVCEELKSRQSLDMVGGRAYIATLTAEVPATANGREYAKIIAEKAVMPADDPHRGGYHRKGLPKQGWRPGKSSITRRGASFKSRRGGKKTITPKYRMCCSKISRLSTRQRRIKIKLRESLRAFTIWTKRPAVCSVRI